MSLAVLGLFQDIVSKRKCTQNRCNQRNAVLLEEHDNRGTVKTVSAESEEIRKKEGHLLSRLAAENYHGKYSRNNHIDMAKHLVAFSLIEPERNLKHN